MEQSRGKRCQLVIGNINFKQSTEKNKKLSLDRHTRPMYRTIRLSTYNYGLQEIADLEQMISSELWTLGRSLSWLSLKFNFCKLRSPHGSTDGREVRQLEEMSSSLIWQEMSMNQSRSTQGNRRPDHFTHTPCKNKYRHYVILYSREKVEIILLQTCLCIQEQPTTNICICICIILYIPAIL